MVQDMNSQEIWWSIWKDFTSRSTALLRASPSTVTCSAPFCAPGRSSVWTLLLVLCCWREQLHCSLTSFCMYFMLSIFLCPELHPSPWRHLHFIVFWLVSSLIVGFLTFIQYHLTYWPFNTGPTRMILSILQSFKATIHSLVTSLLSGKPYRTSDVSDGSQVCVSSSTDGRLTTEIARKRIHTRCNLYLLVLRHQHQPVLKRLLPVTY